MQKMQSEAAKVPVGLIRIGKYRFKTSFFQKYRLVLVSLQPNRSFSEKDTLAIFAIIFEKNTL